MATRLYFPLDTPAAVNPAFSADWTSTGSAVRRKLSETKGTSTLTLGSSISCPNFAPSLDRQYVSTRMASGVFFNFPTVDCYLQALESAIDDNIDTTAIKLLIVSEDGATVRASISLKTTAAPGGEYATVATSMSWFNATGTSLSYTTVAGDRLVLEIGHLNAGGGTTPVAQTVWGENGTDLTAGTGDTSSTKNGWFEITTNISFIGEPASNAAAYVFYRR